jgi:hypothetical protein
MDYGPNKDICISYRRLDGSIVDDCRPYWEAMPLLRPGRYPDMDDKFDLHEDFYLRIRDRIFLIKKGFDYDAASIPKWAWSTIGHPVQLWVHLAALPHDGWYASHVITQAKADWLFLEILHACDRATPLTGKWKATRAIEQASRWSRRNLCWTAVRAAGWAVYPKKKQDLEKYREFVSVFDVPVQGLLS